MDPDDLLARLRYERVDDRAISIGHPFREGTYCLEKTGCEWRVFAVERGERIALSVFDSEHAACEKFLALVLRDSTTRSPKAD